MPDREKRAKKGFRRARLKKEITRVVREAEKLDARIKDLKKVLIKGNFRML